MSTRRRAKCPGCTAAFEAFEGHHLYVASENPPCTCNHPVEERQFGDWLVPSVEKQDAPTDAQGEP